MTNTEKIERRNAEMAAYRHGHEDGLRDGLANKHDGGHDNENPPEYVRGYEMGYAQGTRQLRRSEQRVPRWIHPTGDDQYDVILDGVTVGRITVDSQDTEVPSWRSRYWVAFLAGDETHTQHVYTSRDAAARGLVRSIGFALRDKPVTDLTDHELLLRWEAELHEAWYIAQSDAIGTAAKMSRYDSQYVKPLFDEARKRGIVEPAVHVP